MADLLNETPEVEVVEYGETDTYFEPVAAACSSIVCCCCS